MSPLSAALPITGIALWCVWATYVSRGGGLCCRTSGSSSVYCGVFRGNNACRSFPRGGAAEPHGTETSASVPCAVVVPSETLPVPEPFSHLNPAVEVVYELSSHPDTEDSDETLFCFNPAVEAVCEFSACPVMATGAAFELLSCS